MKTYRAKWGNTVALVEETKDGKSIEYSLDPCFDLAKHSPDGFSWGYEGSGPSQFALALLVDALQSDTIAMKYYHTFKRQIVAKADRTKDFSITDEEIKRFIEIWRERFEL